MDKDISKSSIRTDRHEPTYDSDSLNRAMDRAITDENFFTSCLNLLKGLKFPALKGSIINYIKNATADSDVISLFETLDGYIEYKDIYHVQKALEENDPKRKVENQITDETRQNPIHTSTRKTAAGRSIKESQAVTESEQRKDFPQVNPTAMSDFICKKCGKSFQNQDDLVRHKSFEEGKEKSREVSEKSRTNRESTVNLDPRVPQTVEATTEEPLSKEPINRDMASRMANLLEGLDFPVKKEEIITHIQKKIGNIRKNMDDILKPIQSNLQDNVEYNSVYEIEKASKLVVQKDMS